MHTVTLAIRLCVGVIAVNELVVGIWNMFWPRGFYRYFPTVDQTPPFSEHYARDFGGATLGLALLLSLACLRPKAHFVIPASAAFLVFAVPHGVFHSAHLDHATALEATLLVASLVTVVLLAGAAIVLTLLRDRAAAAPGDPVIPPA